MAQGMIFNIQRFSTHDGPGIRTAVFFKGCNLRCIWCHNPESISPAIDMEFYPEKCISCGFCATVCETGAHFFEGNTHLFDRNRCKNMHACGVGCYTGALVEIGKYIETEPLILSLLEDALYYKNSGGGVTFTGGECMLQIDFLESMLKACKEEGIHTAVDTAGNVPYEYFERINPYVDLYLYDVKAMDSGVHKKLTGVDNTRILENLQRLTSIGKRVFVNIPLIPFCNHGEMPAIASFLKELPIEKITILPYHKLGNAKYEALGIENPAQQIAPPTGAQLQEAQSYFK